MVIYGICSLCFRVPRNKGRKTRKIIKMVSIELVGGIVQKSSPVSDFSKDL